jgi:hypothetical protein
MQLDPSRLAGNVAFIRMSNSEAVLGSASHDKLSLDSHSSIANCSWYTGAQG